MLKYAYNTKYYNPLSAMAHEAIEKRKKEERELQQFDRLFGKKVVAVKS